MAEARLRAAISEVADEVVIRPVKAELAAYAGVREGLVRALALTLRFCLRGPEVVHRRASTARSPQPVALLVSGLSATVRRLVRDQTDPDKENTMNETLITLAGWLGNDVQLRQAGEVPVASFRVATTPRRFQRKTGTWVDGDTQWYTVSAWRDLADNCARSLRRGDPVVVHGRLRAETLDVNSGVEVTELRDRRDLRRPRPLARHQPVHPHGRRPSRRGLASEAA